MGWLTAKSVQQKDAEGLLRFFGGSLPDPEFPASNFLSHVEHGYDKSELVFRCINEGAQAMPQGTLRAYDALGRRGEPLQDHPLRRLLANPNPLLSEYELWEIVNQHLDLAGLAVWEIVRSRAGQIVELWPVRPDRFRMNRNGREVTYSFALNGGKTVPIEAVVFRLPNPADPLGAAPPMRAALRAVAVDNEATSFVKSLLGNSAIPGVVITMGELEHVLDEALTTRLTAKWKSRFAGRRRGEPAFMQAGMDVKQLGLNLKDLEFPDLRAVSESRICMAFEVPAMLVGAKVGLDRSTFSNASEAEKSFWTHKVMNRQRRCRDTIAAQLLPKVDPGGRGRRRVSLRWDNSEVEALRESEEKRWTRATEGFRAGGMTLNDWRTEVGLDEVEGGDVFLIPSGVIAVRSIEGEMQQVNGQATPAGQTSPDVPTEETEPSATEKAYRDTLMLSLENAQISTQAAIGGRTQTDWEGWTKDLADQLYKVSMKATRLAGVEAWAGYNAEQTKNYQFNRALGIATEISESLAAESAAALLAPSPAAEIDHVFGNQRKNIANQAAVWADTSATWAIREAEQQARVKRSA